MSGPDPQSYNCLDGTLLCTTTIGSDKYEQKPVPHLSLSNAGPCTLDTHICVKALKCKVFQIFKCLIKPLFKKNNNNTLTIFQGGTP